MTGKPHALMTQAQIENHRARSRRWVAENAERNRRRAAEWSANNPERKAQKDREHYLENRETIKRRIADRAKRLSAERDERFIASKIAGTHRYRARLRGSDEHYKRGELQSLRAKSKGRCAYCGEKRKLEIDHIRPLSRGGSNAIRNIQLLSAPCNQSKNARDAIDFARSRGMLL
ncbi:MAG: HNH endonuclease [Beijerinckiaceae bacterium]|nr:HNH endonuclease [Beijerinckiaceae bacterium]